jgi:hypothetical protein
MFDLVPVGVQRYGGNVNGGVDSRLFRFLFGLAMRQELLGQRIEFKTYLIAILLSFSLLLWCCRFLIHPVYLIDGSLLIQQFLIQLYSAKEASC